MKKILLTLTVYITSFQVSYAQTIITGKVLDESGGSVPYANIILKSSGKPVTNGILTDSIGAFSIQSPSAGKFELHITAIGFLELKTDVEATGGQKDLGSLSLKPTAQNLKNVTLTSLRPTIIQKADRMIVSVEGTAMASGSNAYSVLTKAPGVFIDPEGNIQLNGRGGVTVMIDGKLTYLSARDLRAYLEGMSAENIKNIEIITNPSAKYDAEGTAGILNINLKKNTLQGMNGSVYSSINYNFKQHGYTAGGNINIRSGRWNSFLNLDMARRVGGREATFTRIFYGTNKTTYFDQVATGNFRVQGPPAVRLGSDYTINDRHSVGFVASYTTNKAKQDFLTDTWIGNAPDDPYQYIDADNISSNTYTNRTANIHYAGKLDTSGTTLSADVDYVKIFNRGEANFYNYFTDLSSAQKSQDLLYTSTPNGYNIYSGKIDFVLPFNKNHKMESGIKASRVVSDNDFRFYFNNGTRVPDPQRTNHFVFDENIYAAYLNWVGDISKKISMQAGLRAEQTQSTGESFTTGQVTHRKYLDFFPSAFLQHKVSDNYNIGYSYSRRLTRPNYGNLNPFKAYRDPYTWIEGNPYLRPQYTNAFSITQTFKKLYNLILTYNLHKDVMSELPILDVANAVTVYTTGNVNDGKNISASLVGPLKITKKWDTQNTLLLSYNEYNMTSINGSLSNDQVLFSIQSNHTIQLPAAIRMELNLLYRGPTAYGLYHMAGIHRVDVAVKRSFMKKKIDLTLNAYDIFAGHRFIWTTNINGNVNEFDQYFRFRSIGATIRYNFSKGLKVDVKQRGGVDELNRL